MLARRSWTPSSVVDAVRGTVLMPDEGLSDVVGSFATVSDKRTGRLGSAGLELLNGMAKPVLVAHAVPWMQGRRDCGETCEGNSKLAWVWPLSVVAPSRRSERGGVIPDMETALPQFSWPEDMTGAELISD